MADDFDPYAALDVAHEEAAGTALYHASKTTPDRAATVQRYAKALGLPPETVDRNFAEVEPRVKADGARAALANSPLTREAMGDVNFASVAQDHIPDLTLAERTVQSLRDYAGSIPAGLVKSVGMAVRGIPQGIESLADSATRGLAAYDEAMFPSSMTGAKRDVARMTAGTDPNTLTAKRAGQAIEKFGSKIGAPPGRQNLGTQILEGLGQVGGQVAQAVFAPETLIPALLGQGAAMEQDEADKVGKGGTAAADLAVIANSGVNAALERFGVFAILERVPPKVKNTALRYFADLATAGGIEAAEEAAQQIAQNAITQHLLNPKQKLLDGVAENAQAGGGVGILARALLTLAPGRARMAHIENQDAKAETAKPMQEKFNDLVKATTALPLRERSPVQFKAFVDKIADGLDVHVNAEALQTYLQSVPPEEAQALVQATGIKDQLDAASKDTDIVIKGSDYLTHIGPTDAHKALENDIKIGPAGMSVNEAEAHKGDREALLADAAAKALGEGVNLAAVEDPKARVRQHAYEMALAGGRPEGEAQAYATIQASHAEARAARNARFSDAWAAYSETNPSLQKGSITVAGPAGVQVAGGQKFEQPVYHGTPHEFDEFNLNAIGTGEGAQAYGHGLYFAGNKKVAEYYKKQLVEDRVGPGRRALDAANGDTETALAEAQRKLNHYENMTSGAGVPEDRLNNFRKMAREVKKELERYKKTGKFNEGRLLHVEIPEDDQFLDWDKPLSEQPTKAREALAAVGYAPPTRTVATLKGKPVTEAAGISGSLRVFINKYLVAAGGDVAKAEADFASAVSPSKDAARQINEDYERKEAWAAVRKAVGKKTITLSEVPTDPKGHAIYQALGAQFGKTASEQFKAENPKALPSPRMFPNGAVLASEALRKGGLAGLRYLDGGSRGEDDGTHNYVIFDAAHAKITRFEQSVQTDSEAFKAWFGDSKVVDASGKPLVVYHGTNADLTQFEADREGGRSHTFGNYTVTTAGIFFAEDPTFASQFLKTTDHGGGRTSYNPGGNVMPVYLKIEKPFMLDDDGFYGELTRFQNDPNYRAVFEKHNLDLNSIARMPSRDRWELLDDDAGADLKAALKELGYDGVFLRETDHETSEAQDVWVVFDPTQIKSATGNRGSFDPANPNILKQGPRGDVSFSKNGALIRLFKSANASTLIHEGAGHIWLEELGRDAAHPDATQEVKDDLNMVKAWWSANIAQAGIDSGVPLKRLEKALRLYGTGLQNDLEAIRPFHEMFARAGERYLMEGKAPTEELRSPFAKFRTWLVGIYKDLSRLNVPMTDDLRGVFDRLVAVPEAIATAKTQTTLDPWTTEQGQKLGMSPQEIEAYLKVVQLADEAAHDRMLGVVMGDIRRQYTADWKAEHAALAEDNMNAMAETPEGVALNRLMNGARINRQDLIDAGIDPANLYGNFVSKDGLHPDVIAEEVGMSSGESLTGMLANLKTVRNQMQEVGDTRPVLRAMAENMADEQMLARHGDILHDGTIGDEAVAAINDMRRSEVLMAEVRALVRKAGATSVVWSESEMQSWAAAQIAKRDLNGIRPHIYAAAEAKAGRDALKALVTDDFAAALDAKFRQLLNMHLYRAARAAREDITKGKKLFDRVVRARNGTISKTRNMDYVATARAILAPYGFEGAKNDADYMRKMEDYNPVLAADMRVVIENATADPKPVDELTYDEFTSLVGIVDALWAQSRAERVLEIEGRQEELADVAQEVSDHLDSIGTKRPVAGRDASPLDEMMLNIAGGFAATRRMEEWVTLVDGGPTGPFRTYIWNPVSRAGTALAEAKRRVTQQYLDLFAPVADKFKRGKIEAPELGHTFGFRNNGVGMSELVHMLAHMGNDSNKRKLLIGRGWATENADGVLDTSRVDAFIQRKIDDGAITKEVMDYVQGLWDLLDSLKPDIQRVHRAVYGRYMDEVPPTPFVTPWGTYKGGYVPAVYDKFFDADQAAKAEVETVESNNDASMFPTSPNSFTKGRTQYTGYIALDVGLLLQHINKVLTFTHMTQPTRDVLRIIKEGGVEKKLQARDPVAFGDLILPWLNRSARQTVETPTKGRGGKAIDTFFRALRHRAGMGIMMGNISNAIQQLTGQFPILNTVGPSTLAAANWRMMRDPAGVTAMIHGLSSYMSTRLNNGMSEVHEQLNYLLADPTKFQQASDFAMKHAYVLQRAAAHYTDCIAWMATFDHEMGEHGDIDAAVERADSEVRLTQGAMRPEDISRVEVASPLIKALTQFYGWFNTQMNHGFTQGALALREQGAERATRVARVYATLLMLPAVSSGLVMAALGSGWKDDDEEPMWEQLLKLFFGSQFTYLTGMLPYVGGTVNLVANAFDDKPYNDSINPPPAMASLGKAALAPHDVWRVVTDEDHKGQKQAVRDVLTLATLLSGSGIPQMMGRPLGYLADIHEGKVTPTSGLPEAVPEDVGAGLDFARGLVTGAASEKSRVAH